MGHETRSIDAVVIGVITAVIVLKVVAITIA